MAKRIQYIKTNQMIKANEIFKNTIKYHSDVRRTHLHSPAPDHISTAGKYTHHHHSGIPRHHTTLILHNVNMMSHHTTSI